MNNGLPQGWSSIPLGDLVSARKGKKPRAEKPLPGRGFIPYLDIRAIEKSEVSSYAEAASSRLGTADDVLIVWDGARSGWAGLGREGAIGSTIMALQPKAGERTYLYRWLQTQFEHVNTNTRGTGIPHVDPDVFWKLDVPFAPLPEQRRIVAKLEKLLDRAYACQQRMAKIPVLLKRFRQSVLAAACFGRLTADWRDENANVENASTLVAELERIHEAAGGHKKGNAAPPSDEAHDLSADDLPSSWRLTEMRSVVCPDRPITYGILKPGPDTPGGIPYVRVADFPNDRLNLETIRRTTKEIERAFARARLRAGDILLSIRGTVGRVCVVPRELKDANITQDTARLSVQPALKAGFVKWFLRAAPTQKRMHKAVKGVAVRGINIGDVRALQMPVPPLAEQQEIVRRVEGLFALADQLEARYAKAKAHVEKLTQSILAKAFRGELVPQDPNDEPASVLLERIKQQRDKASSKKSSKRQQAHVARA